MKNLILRLVFSRLGPSVTAGISLIVGTLLGWIVSGLSSVGIYLDARQQATVSLAISGTLYWLIMEIVNKYAGEHAAALQSALQKANPSLKVDRWIGDETVKAAMDAAQAAAANLSTGEIYEGKPVPQEAPAPKKKPAKTKAKVVRKVKDTSESVSPS